MMNQLTQTNQTFDISIFEIQNDQINLTKICNHFSKRIDVWLKSKSTQRFLEAYKRVTPNGGIRIIQGDNSKTEQGTFGDRKIALKLAEWISVDFEIWCNKQIDTLFQIGKVELQSKPVTIDQILELNVKAINQLQQKVLSLESENKELTPKAKFIDDTFAVGNIGLTAMNMVAKNLQIGAVQLYKKLRDKKIWFYSLNEFGKFENNVSQNYTGNYFVIKNIWSNNQNRSFEKIFATAKGKMLCHKIANEN